MDYTPTLPKHYRRLTDGRHPLATGAEVDAMLAASAARGYLLLPWVGGHGCPRRGSVALRLSNRWWIECDQQQPFVAVEVRKAGDRAVLHYDLLYLTPQACDFVALGERLDAFFDTCDPARKRRLHLPLWGGAERSSTWSRSWAGSASRPRTRVRWRSRWRRCATLCPKRRRSGGRRHGRPAGSSSPRNGGGGPADGRRRAIDDPGAGGAGAGATGGRGTRGTKDTLASSVHLPFSNRAPRPLLNPRAGCRIVTGRRAGEG
jgi:hypothetical protein